jgi:hypothetical protein
MPVARFQAGGRADQAERDRVILEYTQAVYAQPGITPEAAAAQIAQAMDQFDVSPQEFSGAFQRDTTVVAPEQRAVFGDVGTVQQAYEAVRPTGQYSSSFVGPVSSGLTTPVSSSGITISPNVNVNTQPSSVITTPTVNPALVGPPSGLTSIPVVRPSDIVINPPVTDVSSNANSIVINPPVIPVDDTYFGDPDTSSEFVAREPTRADVIRDYVDALYKTPNITSEEAALNLATKMDEVGVSPH